MTRIVINDRLYEYVKSENETCYSCDFYNSKDKECMVRVNGTRLAVDCQYPSLDVNFQKREVPSLSGYNFNFIVNNKYICRNGEVADYMGLSNSSINHKFMIGDNFYLTDHNGACSVLAEEPYDIIGTFKVQPDSVTKEEAEMEGVIFTDEELLEEGLLEEGLLEEGLLEEGLSELLGEELGFKSSKEMFEYLLDGGVVDFGIVNLVTVNEFGELIDYEDKHRLGFGFNLLVSMTSQGKKYQIPLWYMQEFKPCLCKVGYYPVADLPMENCEIAVVNRYCTLTKIFHAGNDLYVKQYRYAIPLTQVEVDKYING